MIKYLLIFIGGGLGALFRFVLSYLIQNFFSDFTFPIGTLTVNIIGSFIIGFMWGIVEYRFINQEIRAFLLIGILGGFTTYSSFMLESFNLFYDKEILYGILNIGISIFAGLFSVISGYFISRWLFR